MSERVPRTRSARARHASKEELGRRVTTAQAYGGETVEQETVERVSFPAGVEPAFVRVGVGQTYNLGNYESLRLDVSVTLPCLPTEEDINETHRRASDFVAEKLNEEEVNWMGTREPSKSSKKR